MLSSLVKIGASAVSPSQKQKNLVEVGRQDLDVNEFVVLLIQNNHHDRAFL